MKIENERRRGKPQLMKMQNWKMRRKMIMRNP